MPTPRGRIWETEVLARQLVTGLRRWSSVLLAALLAVGLGGCGNTDSWVEAAPAQGWSAQYADAANSSYTTTSGANKLSLQWTRSVKGSLAAGPALSASNYLALNAQTPAGCSLMEWENNDNGPATLVCPAVPGRRLRRSPVRRLRQSLRRPAGSLPVLPGDPVDAVAPTGDRDAVHPAVSWRAASCWSAPTWDRCWFSTPTVARWSAARWTWWTAIDPTDSMRGLADCAPARPGCPVAAAPAFSTANGMVVLGVWQPGAPAAGLVGLKYHRGQTRC